MGQLSTAELIANVESLLSEGKQQAIKRERSEFERLCGPVDDRIVLFGAGNLGRKTARGLRSAGIEPLAFTDNNPKLWHTKVEGVMVLPPQEAAARYATEAAFVITVWSGLATDRMRDRQKQLRSLGCRYISTFAPLFWKFSTTFLPHYAADLPHKVFEQADEVLRTCELWADGASRQEYLAQLQWRLLGDFDPLPPPVRETIYFPRDVCPVLRNEVFVDCGAYDGDTIATFLAQVDGSFERIFAFEPDPANYVRLSEFTARLARPETVKIVQAAVSDSCGTLRFEASADESSRVGQGDTIVPCVSLDTVLDGVAPTYIKMDIEGAELEALNGARRSIEGHSPVLAVCSYHRQDHLWKIPLLIQSFSNDYRYFLRPQLVEGWDLVCYAIPTHRLAAAQSSGA